MRFVIIAFVASCILAIIAIVAPSRRGSADLFPQTVVEPGREAVTPATIRRIRS